MNCRMRWLKAWNDVWAGAITVLPILAACSLLAYTAQASEEEILDLTGSRERTVPAQQTKRRLTADPEAFYGTDGIAGDFLTPGEIRQFLLVPDKNCNALRVSAREDGLVMELCLYSLEKGRRNLMQRIRTDETDVLFGELWPGYEYVITVSALSGTGGFELLPEADIPAADIGNAGQVWDLFADRYDILRYDYRADAKGWYCLKASPEDAAALFALNLSLLGEGEGEIAGGNGRTLKAQLKKGCAYILEVSAEREKGDFIITKKKTLPDWYEAEGGCFLCPSDLYAVNESLYGFE